MIRLTTLLTIALVAGCGSGDTKQRATTALEESVPLGQYQTDSIAPFDSVPRVITLELRQDASAVLTTDAAGQTAVVREGQFTATGLNLEASFPAAGRTTAAVFRWRLISGRLVPVDWDRTQYGLAGLTLHKH